MRKTNLDRQGLGRDGFEALEARRLLAAAATAAVVELPGAGEHTRDERGLVVSFIPQTYVLQQRGAPLTGKQVGTRAQIARNALVEYAPQLGISAADARATYIHQQNYDAHNGVTHVYFKQTLNDLTVRNTDAGVHILPGGKILTITSNLVPFMDVAQRTAPRPELAGMIHPTLALRSAVTEFGLRFDGVVDTLEYKGGVNHEFVATDRDLSRQDIPIKAEYVPTAQGLRLAWNFNLDFTDNSGDWYEVSVDAQNGKIIWANNYTSHSDWGEALQGVAGVGTSTEPVGPVEPGQGGQTSGPSITLSEGGVNATYNVFALPMESPYDGDRVLVTNPWEAAGTDPLTSPSPYGWHDTNGIPGHDTSITVGNNVNAQDDINNNNGNDGLKPNGGPNMLFDFPVNLATQQPSEYTAAAVVNLFYYNNILHDLHYIYGFTEKWWNFQTHNYGREGTSFPNGGAGDEVQADAQDGGGTNNANFATPADGSKPRMQMYLWNVPSGQPPGTPRRDGDFDNGIIAHEYGHGVSNRLTTRGAGQMANIQSRGMGEGWSDWHGLMFTQKVGDTAGKRRGIGTYALFQDPVTGNGIRTHPYSFDTTINPITWGYYGSGTYQSPYNPGVNVTRSTAVHWAGTIWAATLWDMNWLLIDKHGFDSNFYTGYNASGTAAEKAGNKLALQLVMDGMKLQPNNPTFIQSRDAILQADIALTGGANQNEIWEAFARRGLGEGASLNPPTATSTSTANLILSFQVPWPDPTVSLAGPTGTTIGSVSNLTFQFNEPMNPASFSINDDIVSFTGPTGDVMSRVTGATWSAGNTVLTINTLPLAKSGQYTIVIGPDILSADDGTAMDQNRNGIPGEPTDTFTHSFNVTKLVGPETFGYAAAEHAYEPIDLIIDSPGVTTHINGSAALAPVLNLPAGNTFNFYGTTYTSMFPSTEGLIAFGSGTTSSTNGPLTSSPTQQTIAPYWDNWSTSTNGGPTDSSVLWTIRDGHLIIEWSDVTAATTSNGSVTFQAILELNTGTRPGRIRFNYPDLDVIGPTASVGIKDSGTQTSIGRFLTIHNVTSTTTPGLVSSWVETGKAIIIGLDVDAPEVDSSTFVFEDALRVELAMSEDVEATFNADNINVINRTTGVPLARNYLVGYDTATNVGSIGFNPATLPDADYRIIVASDPFGDGVKDAAGNALDGDEDGVGGGDFVYDFFFLRGDANRDRKVDIGDFAILAGNFNQSGTFSAGDFNFDGQVGIGDFSILASNFNYELPPPIIARAGLNAGTSEAGSRLLAAPSSPFSGTRIDRLAEGVLGDPV